MKQQKLTFLKFISIIHRNTHRYFESILQEYHIGGGQQFFLGRIYENDGISMYDLAKMGHFDKGTVTKAVRKLEELGYVEVRMDAGDRRLRRLYVTEAAKPVIREIYHVRKLWREALAEDLPVSEEELYHILQLMAEKSCNTIEAISEKKKSKEKGDNRIE